eukprot:8020862-Pyramimonas_sp.AAC.1
MAASGSRNTRGGTQARTSRSQPDSTGRKSDCTPLPGGYIDPPLQESIMRWLDPHGQLQEA